MTHQEKASTDDRGYVRVIFSGFSPNDIEFFKEHGFVDENRTPEEDYSEYKVAVKRREKLMPGTFGGSVRRMVGMLTKSPQGYADYYNEAMRAPDKAREVSRHYLEANLHELKQMAVNEATKAGVELSLPEDGQPEMAINVRPAANSDPHHGN